MELRPGSRVAVVGGGPAGSFFALHVMEFARRERLPLEVDIYEPRDFSLPGPLGCNRCAGILSTRALRGMKELGLELPETVVLGRIQRYLLVSPFGTIEITNPQATEATISVYRGGGPRYAPVPPETSFDRFLLGEAERRGARLLRLRVRGLRLTPRPAVFSAEGWREYRLIALCTGVNGLPMKVEGIDYRPPATLRMSQDELLARREDVEEFFGATVKVFLFPRSPLVFGTLVPKGELINVSLLGHRQLPSVAEFLSHPLVQATLPFPYRKACGCRPLISVGQAASPFGDGFVTVGDAGVTRLYKDGIGAALTTARQAAHTAVYHGVSRAAFRRHYQPTVSALNRDNAYGRLLFRLHGRIKDSPSVFRAHAHLAQKERAAAKPRRPFNNVVWGMFTGSDTYGQLLRTALAPGFQFKLSWHTLRERLRRRHITGPARIVVLGGGFGGIYSTLRLAKVLGRNPGVEVTLINRDNFFLFAPLLHEVAAGTIETRHIALPIRALRGRKKFRLLTTEVFSVDLAEKLVHTDAGIIPYDYVVLALGGVPEPLPPSFQSPDVFALRTLYDGIYLRNHIIQLFEKAEAGADKRQALLTFVVVGGGAIGVQIVAEMRDFILGALARHYREIDRSRIRIILVSSEDKLLPDMDDHIARYALSHLRKKGIEVKLSAKVTGVWEGGIELENGEHVATRTVVWSPGMEASPVVAGLPVEKDELGRVIVNPYLEIPGARGAYALGDNAHVTNSKNGRPLPARAHVAVRQPGTVVKNIIADLKGQPKRTFAAPWMADMVSLGPRCAAIKLFGVRLYGFPARALWLAGYLALLPHGYNRIRVGLDWFLSLLFGRDNTLLRLH